MSDDISEKVKTYMSRHEQMKESQNWLEQDRALGDYESSYLLLKREEIKPGLMKTKCKKERFKTLWDELVCRWERILQHFDMDYLPPSAPMSFGRLQKLHQRLDTIMERQMKKAGMGGFQSDEKMVVDVSVSGDRIVKD